MLNEMMKIEVNHSCENSFRNQPYSSQACEPKYQWLGPFYHRSRETDRLRRAAVSWWFTKPEDLSFLFDQGCIAPVGTAPGPKVDLDQASDQQLRNLAAIAEIVDDSEETADGSGGIAGVAKTKHAEEGVVDWATVGARLIAHAERVREMSRGKDWMSRYAEDYVERSRDDDGIGVEFAEVPHENTESEEAKDGGEDAAEMERLQKIFDQHLRESYPTMDGDFGDEYQKWSATCDSE